MPSRTTLLGLVKQVTFVEGVWFDQAITGRTREQIGIASVQAAHRAACGVSRGNVAELCLDGVISGNGGERSLWRIHLHMLRELAQHLGRADILREQVLDLRRPLRRA